MQGVVTVGSGPASSGVSDVATLGTSAGQTQYQTVGQVSQAEDNQTGRHHCQQAG